MDNGIKLEPKKDYSIAFQVGAKDKHQILVEFSKLFHQSRQMMDWFDDGQVPVDQKLEHFYSLFRIFESIHELLVFMLKAGIPEKDIAEILNVPF